jgi:hypothetical protein
MKKNNVPDPLAKIFRVYLQVNAITNDWPAAMRIELGFPHPGERERLFRSQLADAILRGTVSREDYEQLTGEDFDTDEQLKTWLVEVWREIYGDARIEPPSLA